MGETEYSEALKLGKKEYRARIAKDSFPICQYLMKSYQRQILRQSRIWGWSRCLWISL